MKDFRGRPQRTPHRRKEPAPETFTAHSFADGAERTAWIVARRFLADNGYRFPFDKAEAVRTVEALASGALSQDDLASWFRTGLFRRDE